MAVTLDELAAVVEFLEGPEGRPSQSAYRDALIRRTRQVRSKFEIHQGVENMAEMMWRADIDIGAGGVASCERCCLGLPSIIFSLPANQKPVARYWHDAQAGLYLRASRLCDGRRGDPRGGHDERCGEFEARG